MSKPFKPPRVVSPDSSPLREVLSEGENTCETFVQIGLFNSICVSDRDKIKTLLEKIPDINSIRYTFAMTPLMLAAKFSTSEIVSLFLKKGSDTKAKDFSNLTALMHACSTKQAENIKTILQEDLSSVNDKDNFGRTALVLSVIEKDFLSVKEFAKYRQCDPNTTDVRGRTALHYACENGDRDCARILVEMGIDKWVKDSTGKCPWKCLSDPHKMLFLQSGVFETSEFGKEQ